MKKTVRISIVAVVCVAILVGYYYYLSHRDDEKAPEEVTEVTEVQKLINRDFEKDYPETPREVVKWYNRMITCFYGEEYTDDEFQKLVDQTRILLDTDLLGYNPRESYVQNLQAEITDYKNRDKKILQSSVSDSKDVVYKKVKGDDCAYVRSYYFCSEGSNYTRTYMKFVLRKDSTGQWKILAFELTEGDADEQ